MLLLKHERRSASIRFNKSQLRALLGRQLGLITGQQWIELGFSASGLRRACDRDEFVRVLPAVYRSTLVPPSLHAGGLAAVLWAGDGARVSHTTAARTYGAELPGNKPHIWVPPDRAPKSELVVVHRGVVAKNDRWMREGVPLTSPARTLIDLASMLDCETLEAVAEDFFHRAVTTPMSVQRCLDASGGTGRAGSQSLRSILENRDQAPLQKRLEVKLSRLLLGAGLRPVRQFKVRVANRTSFLDFAFPALKVAVQGHGFVAHGGRMHHRDDARRLADLASVGWTIVPVTWEAATGEPDVVIDQVRSALAEAAA